MKIVQSHWPRFWHLYAIGIADIVVLGVARLFLAPAVGQFDWPTWVQAVGSISAILVAIWVSSDQAAQQRLRDEIREASEIEGLIRSVKAELETSLIYLSREVIPVLEKIAPGDPICYYFRLPDYPFPIFDALIPKLGMLPPKVRRDLIYTYAQAKSMAITTSVHNDLIQTFEDVEIRYRDQPPRASKGEFAGALRALTDYSVSFRLAFDETHKRMGGMLKTLSDMHPDE